MINNYDSVVACPYTATPHSQKQEGTSYTATKRNWLSFVTVLVTLFCFSFVQGQSTANYTFSTNATGSLALDANGNTVDMSTGTTQLVLANSDQGVSSITNIGFNYYFYGNLFNQFSVSANGILQLGSTVVSGTTYVASGGTTTSPKFSAIGSDAITASTADGGGVFSKVVGSAPNRCLVVQWVSYLYWGNTSSPATFQVRLYETSGIVEYVYGSMPVGATSFSSNYSTGFSVGNSANQLACITTSTNIVSTSTFTTNAYTAGTNIANLDSSLNGSRRVYTFTPPVPASGPTGLTISGATQTAMTLNWTAASPTTNIVRYAVFNSTNGGATYNFVANVPLGTHTFNATGLASGTTYDWRVVAISEGVESTATTATQATTAATTYYWVGTSSSGTPGAFATLTNWNTAADGSGTAPAAITATSTDIFIVDGDGSTTTGGNVFISLAANTTVGQFKIISNTALTVQAASGTTARIITVTGAPGDDFVIETGSTLNLTTATPAGFAFSGADNTGLIAGTLNFAGSGTGFTANIFTTTGGTRTLVTVPATGVVNMGSTAVSLVGNLATLFFDNGSNCNVTGATTGAYPIPSANWATNSTVTLSGSSSTTTAGNNIQSFGNFVVNLPLLTGTLSFWTSSTTAVIKGNLIITAAGATGGTGIFRALTSGTLTVNGDVNVLQGRLQSANGAGIFNVLGNTTISTNGILDINGGTYNQRGTTFTNDGTLTAVAGSTRLAFAPLTSIAQTFAGSGTVLTNIGGLSLSNPAGLTITHTNQITTLRVNLFQGTITGSNKITFGTGLALVCITQIGSTGLTTPGGSFDASPTFNLGTGAYNVVYAQESVARTTGFEIPSSRSISSLDLSNSNGLTVSGGALAVTGTLTMTSGLINTTATNLLTLGTATAAGTLSGTPSATNMIVGPFARTFATRTAVGTYDNTTLYPVGKGTAYTPVFVDPTIAAASAATIRGEAFATNSGSGSVDVTDLSATRWEVLTTNGFANLTNANVRVSESGILSSYALVQAPTAAGVYDRLFSGTSAFAAGPILTGSGISATALTNAGYFAYGTLAAIQPPTITGFTPLVLCANGGPVVTITGVNLGTVTSVLFNSISGVDLPGTITAKTATTVTVIAPSGVVDGVIKVINPAGNVDSTTSFTVVTPPTIGVSAPATICAGSSTTLTATGGVTYTWAPATGLSATTGTSVTASPSVTTTYTVTGVSAEGCSSTSTVTVTTLPVPSAITITKNPTSICEGGITTLTAAGGQIPLPGTATIGNATTLSAAASLEPTAFNNRFKHYWVQMVYTPAELNAAGVTAGNITAVRFTTSTLGDAPTVTDLKVRMGTSSSATLSAFQTSGLTLVKTSATYTHAVGENILTFDTPYAWDGVSNLLFDLRSTGADDVNNARTLYTATTGNTVVSAVTSTVSTSDGFAATNPSASVSTFRLNTTFNCTVIGNGPISWSPTTYLYTDALANTAYTGTPAAVVYAKLTAPETYTATATLGSCSVSTPVTVTPNALPTITLDATTPVCNGGTSSSLSYTATTGSPTQYTIDFNEVAELAGFADVLSYTTLTSPISLVVPAGAAPGTYTGTVSVKNANGCISAIPQTFTVVINTPVAITTQPSNSVSLENSNASFTVVASGSDLTYQWQESTDGGLNWNNISGATSPTYTALSVTNAMNGYKYQCIVSGATPCTSVTSSVVSLTISTTAIATQPLSTTICSSNGSVVGSATFTIATTGTTPTYQWQISTDSGASWSDIAGETTNTLTVSGLTAATTQRYRCVLSGLINSDAAILTVNDIVAITSEPADVTVCSNAANATFTTVATGTGLTYQWQQRANSSGTWANVGTGTTGGTTATLTISTLSTSLDGYQYQCIVTGTAPCVGQTTTTATLSVTGYTLANSTTNNNICNGGSVTFTATPTTSSPALTYSWECATAGSGATTPVTGSVATITPTQVGSYTYTLTATGGSCSFTSTQTIVVNVLPVITTATANPTVACAGSTINLAATIVENVPDTIILGAGASTSTLSANNPFYGGYGGVKTQYLFRASELTALGLTAGNITSLGLDITTVGATLSGFGVNIASTTLTALTTNIETVTNNVFTGTFTPVMGVNTITFSSPFNWDGSSNIIVSFCWSNANTSNTASTVKVDTTPFVSANARYVDSQLAADVCSYTGSTTPSGWNGGSTSGSTRPKFLFSGIKANNNTANYDWSWSDGSATVLSIASGTATLPAGATTTYTVTATNRTTLCSASQNVTVSTAVSALALTGVTPATSNICVGTSVTLTAAPTGGCIPYTYSWSDGTSEVGTSASLTVSPTSTKTYTVTVVDNTGTATVNASSTITVNNPQPASVVNQTICAASSAFTLSAVASGTGNLLNWYAAPTGGSVLASGATFTTPSLSATTTYYVEENALGTATTGLGRVSTTSVSNTTPSTYGLVFDLNAKSKLNSVDVYLASTTAGNLVVQLQNSAGTVINSKTIAVPAGNATTPVQYTVPLDFIIPAGTGYRLLAISGTAMVRESVLGGFPYSLGAFGNITGGYIVGASTTYYYFYNWSLSDVCTGIRVPVTATLNAPPSLVLASSAATICSGQSTAAVALTSDPLSFTGYSWSPATGVSGTSASGWTFNPTTTTTYTLSATDGTCSNTTTFTVNVNPSPSAMTITPATPAVCVDAIQALTVSGGTISNVSILNETFNGTPTGWTAANISSGGTPANAAWQIYISDINASSNDNSNFIGSSSDAQGSGGTTDTSLTSPVFNLSNFSSASLKFYHHFDVFLTQPDTGKVQVSTNGTTWDDVITYTTDQGTITGFVLSTINLNAYVGNPSVQIRFKYNASWGNFWLIDNVSVSGTPSTQITWSPDTNLYTNAAATTPYTLGTNATTVYVKSASAATTTYTAKATAAVTNCETTATVDVIVNPNNTVSTASTTPTVCINTAITDITHTTTGATGFATTTTNYGLPAGVTAVLASNTITISGTPTASGPFNYDIPLTGGCGTVSATGTITVTANNTASAASSSPTVCINTAITDITHTTTGATGFATTTTNYGLPAGVTAVLASNTITISGTPTASGPFNYDIPLTGGCGTVSATGTITVTANNTASAASSSPTVCINTAITDITHTTTGATGFATTTTNYGLPAGVTAVLASNTITISGTPTASGPFNYDIPLTGGCGTVSATGTITVTPLPGWFNTQFPSSASICEGGSAVIYGQVYLAGITDLAGQASGMTAQLGYSSSNTDPNTWTNWINASFNVQTGNNDEFLANIGSSLGVGTYFYAFRYSYNGCTYVYGGLNGPWNGTTNNSGTLTINALPVATITRAGDDLTATETGATYQWYNCTSGSVGALISGATTQSYTATATGSYAVEVTKNGCSEMSACFDVDTLSGNSFDLAKLSYYPNPVIDVLTISYTNEITAVQVYDISGRLVRDMKPNSNEVTVDLSDLAASVYVVKVFADTTSGEFKVVKK